MVWPTALYRFSTAITVPIKLIDSERTPTVFIFAAAAADSRRLTRALALSARPRARTIR